MLTKIKFLNSKIVSSQSRNLGSESISTDQSQSTASSSSQTTTTTIESSQSSGSGSSQQSNHGGAGGGAQAMIRPNRIAVTTHH